MTIKLSFAICAAVLWLVPTVLTAQTETWSGKQSSFHSFAQYDFTVGELKGKVVVPAQVADGKPWVWRARFFGHEPQADIALLKKGFHIAYVNVAGLYGSPQAVARWDAFYEYLTTTKGFAKKPALEGMSRGGLIPYNWAAQNPEKVCCIYADAPVCDFKSWPGINKAILAAYGLTKAEAEEYNGNPVDNLKPLALAKVPLLHVVGDADTVVPVAENTAVVERRYKALGGSIQVIHKKGVGHHPHSLKDPQPIVDFILEHARPSEPVRVACVGDSITFGSGIKNRGENSYPAQLAALLGGGYAVRNFGVGGATLLRKGNKPYWKTNPFRPAHDFNPHVVVIKLGTNDSKPENWKHKGEYVADYVALINSFRQLDSKPKVWICYPVPAYPGRWGITDTVMKEEVVPLIDEVAKQTNVEIIDLYAALSNRKSLFPDTVHPNADGAKVMAETIHSEITDP
jgi:lysophospholipase L1-like esterase